MYDLELMDRTLYRIIGTFTFLLYSISHPGSLDPVDSGFFKCVDGYNGYNVDGYNGISKRNDGRVAMKEWSYGGGFK